MLDAVKLAVWAKDTAVQKKINSVSVVVFRINCSHLSPSGSFLKVVNSKVVYERLLNANIIPSLREKKAAIASEGAKS